MSELLKLMNVRRKGQKTRPLKKWEMIRLTSNGKRIAGLLYWLQSGDELALLLQIVVDSPSVNLNRRLNTESILEMVGRPISEIEIETINTLDHEDQNTLDILLCKK